MRAILLSIALLGALQTVDAHGLEAGFCGPIDTTLEKLNDAGQHIVATGTAIAEGQLEARPQLVSILFLANPVGRDGYIVQTDKPLNLGAASVCVRNRLEGVRLYDPWLSGVRTDSLVRTTEVEADRGCAPVLADEYVLQGCEWLNSILQRSEDTDQRLFLQGHDVRMTENSAEERVTDLLTVLIRDPSRPGPESLSYSFIYLSMPDGATTISRIFNGVEVTEDGERLVTSMEGAQSSRVDGHEMGARRAEEPLSPLSPLPRGLTFR